MVYAPSRVRYVAPVFPYHLISNSPAVHRNPQKLAD